MLIIHMNRWSCYCVQSGILCYLILIVLSRMKYVNNTVVDGDGRLRALVLNFENNYEFYFIMRIMIICYMIVINLNLFFLS